MPPKPRPQRPDPRVAIRDEVRRLTDRGMPQAMATAVANGRLTANEAWERLATRAEVDTLMRRHDLSRAIATQIVLKQASLEAYLASRRMDEHRAANRDRSCLEESLKHNRLMTFSLHGQRRVEGRISAMDPYHATLEVAGQPPETLHKLQFKMAWLPDDWKRVKKVLSKDKVRAEAPLTPVERPQDRYNCSDKRLFRYLDSRCALTVTLLEGEVLTGHLAWFGRYELGIAVKENAVVTVFRHALADVRESA